MLSKVAAVALANKMAKMAGAITAKGELVRDAENRGGSARSVPNDTVTKYVART